MPSQRCGSNAAVCADNKGIMGDGNVRLSTQRRRGRAVDRYHPLCEISLYAIHIYFSVIDCSSLGRAAESTRFHPRGGDQNPVIAPSWLVDIFAVISCN